MRRDSRKNVLAIGCERGLVHFLALDGTGKTRKPVWQYRTERAGERWARRWLAREGDVADGP